MPGSASFQPRMPGKQAGVLCLAPLPLNHACLISRLVYSAPSHVPLEEAWSISLGALRSTCDA
eukprot:scaffold79074_cov21-Tisochrysis_lutea.AAC.1